MTVLFELSGLAAGYDERAVVSGVDLCVDAGELVCLLGPNGAGKTTTLLAAVGVIHPMSGTVSLDGRALVGGPSRITREGLSLVPEDRSLFPSLTVAEHLRLGRRRRHIGRDRSAVAESDVTDRDVFGWFPALARINSRRVGLLSGGEQQMVAVARALMGRPKVLMIDELSLGLAPLVVESLLQTLRTIALETGCGVLLVEQHVQLALAASDRAYVMNRGRIVLDGPAVDIAADPSRLHASYLGAADVEASAQGT